MRRITAICVIVTLCLVAGTTVLAAAPDPGSGWSALYVQNVDPTTAAAVGLTFYSQDGSIAGTYDAGSIPPKAMKIIRSDLDFPAGVPAGWRGAVEVQSTAPLAALTLLYWDNATTNSHTLGVYTGHTAPANQAFLPYLAARSDLQTSNIMVQNTSSSPASLTIHWFDRNGVENSAKLLRATIPPKGEQTFNVGEIDPFGTTLGLGSAYIESDQPIATVATMHFGAVDGYASDSYSGATDGDTVLWVPSVFRIYDDSCGNPGSKQCYRSYNIVSIQNIGNEPATITVDFIRYDGVLSHRLTDTIQPKAARAYNTAVQALLPSDMWEALKTDLTLQWRGTMKVTCTNGQKLVGISSLFPSKWYGVPDCLMYPAILQSDGTTNALTFPLAYRKYLADGVTLNQWSTSIVQNLTSNSGYLTVDIYDSIQGTPIATGWKIPIPANGTAVLNTKTAMPENGFTQEQLNALGTAFAGAIYVTPPPGMIVLGNTQMYWMIAGRAGAYPGIPVQ